VGAPTAGRVALMAIHPRYADAILDGRKKVEFRKRPLAADVTTVVIYATSPVKKIIGEFGVGRIVVAPPKELWSQLHRFAGIERSAFDAYYTRTESGVGIMVGPTRRYTVPFALTDLDPEPAVPQSYAYLPERVLGQLHAAPANRRALLDRLISPISNLARIVAPGRVGG
jgi:predicted transcriptional regulator